MDVDIKEGYGGQVGMCPIREADRLQSEIVTVTVTIGGGPAADVGGGSIARISVPGEASATHNLRRSSLACAMVTPAEVITASASGPKKTVVKIPIGERRHWRNASSNEVPLVTARSNSTISGC